MGVIPVNPFVLKDVDFILGALGADDVAPTDPDFAAACDTIQLVPATSTTTWTGLKRNTFTDVSPATWTGTANGAQDWENAESLSRFLHEHGGETRPYLFRPRSGTGPSFKGHLILSEGAIGGSGNAVAPFAVTFGLTGKPTLVPAEEPDGMALAAFLAADEATEPAEADTEPAEDDTEDAELPAAADEA